MNDDEIGGRIESHLDELLRLWHIEQGGEAKRRELELMASVLPFARERSIRVLDLCCGPGDVGRAVYRLYPNAIVDCVDRDAFLVAMCRGVNRRFGIPCNVIMRDVTDAHWNAGLSKHYEVVAVANALHQFDLESLKPLLRDIRDMLCDDGVFVLAEPASMGAPFDETFEAWKAALPPRYTREAWEQLWSRATAIVGYNPVDLWPRNPRRIDVRMTLRGWMSLLEQAGFHANDVVWKDADSVIMAAMKQP